MCAWSNQYIAKMPNATALRNTHLGQLSTKQNRPSHGLLRQRRPRARAAPLLVRGKTTSRPKRDVACSPRAPVAVTRTLPRPSPLAVKVYSMPNARRRSSRRESPGIFVSPVLARFNGHPRRLEANHLVSRGRRPCGRPPGLHRPRWCVQSHARPRSSMRPVRLPRRGVLR